MATYPHHAPIEFLLNGSRVEVDHFSPQTTLLDFIRSRGLTGAKEGCAEGECGACTVVTLGENGQGCAYRTMNSCLMFLPMAAGHEIYTVEALAANGALHEVQQAMVECGGSQCGYCTPGFVMSLFCEQYRGDRTGPCEVAALTGNLCRCTGYRPIREAALGLGPAPDDVFRERLSRPAPQLGPVMYKDVSASFYRPQSLAECFELMTAHPQARIVAGATDLAVESNLQGRRFPCLISVEAIPELRSLRETEQAVEIGAALTLNEIGQRWHNPPMLLSEWLPLFASPQIRNRATMGGNLATASPIGDSAPLLLALDARVRIRSAAGGERQLPVATFFAGYRQTVLEPGELLVAIEIPRPFPSYARFYKVAKRRLDDISTVAACFALNLDHSGKVASARLAYGGVAALPIRARQAEEALMGRLWNERVVRQAQEDLGKTLRPISDHRGSAEYRLALAQSLVERFWYDCQSEVVV